MTEEGPRLSAKEMIEWLEPSLSPWRRVRAVAALLAGLGGVVFVATLWWSEPGPLPGRTHLAFAVLTVFCLAWAGYGAWLLTRRVPLFATDQVIARRAELLRRRPRSTSQRALSVGSRRPRARLRGLP
ncbi:transmembrane transport protein [Nonomuraea diastatica]|uniref:Transmembrane transport protein n=1 Tax=Nonomuraea diastatica TaxID=1848329 RepID=A0A4R4WQ52_9ACTN|nr:transmembrane transport protein [Nonomuraea diastatica]TDD18725.1 transmembrane transport protein [Nonomuraea diastatica]